MCAHYWELFEICEGYPIFAFSEQGSESWNKYIRNWKSGAACHARQINITVNTRDVFTRMWYRTAPAIAFQKRTLECSKCEESGHTARGCKITAAGVLSEEDSIIASCYVSRLIK